MSSLFSLMMNLREDLTGQISMKKGKAIVIAAVLFCCMVIAVPTVVFIVRGNIDNCELPQNFNDELPETAFENTGDLRIMSSNLLVHYESWGGLPVKPRAKKYVEVLNTYKPDVVGVQELCDEWYCCLKNNLPDGYKMLYPVSTGAFVRMTAMIYNSDTLELIDSGNFAYEQKDNPRLRRVVWAVFKDKASEKQFAVTNTHFDLLRDGREEELTLVMQSQRDELLSCVEELSQKYNCPVFSVGDFNTMEDTEYTKPVDIPEIYNSLADKLVDTKFAGENRIYGSEQDWEYPSYDHIFMMGNAEINSFCIMSYDYLTDMSDHYPIFADISF